LLFVSAINLAYLFMVIIFYVIMFFEQSMWLI